MMKGLPSERHTIKRSTCYHVAMPPLRALLLAGDASAVLLVRKSSSECIYRRLTLACKTCVSVGFPGRRKRFSLSKLTKVVATTAILFARVPTLARSKSENHLSATRKTLPIR